MADKKLILIVDDNNQNLKVLSQMLRKEDYQMALANNGEKGLDIANKKEVDLILLDIMMPKMDGFEVCKNLKANDKTKDIPVLFVSALKEIKDKLKGFEVGGADYITKPFNKKEVMARVKTHLGFKEAKEKLELKNEEQEILLKNIETQIWYLKDEQTYGKVNSSHAQFMGSTKEELENKSFSELLDKAEAELCIVGNREVFEKKEKIKSKEWVRNAEGEKRLLKLTKTPKLDNAGNVKYVVVSAEDITEIRRIDNQLRYQIELENLIINLSKRFINFEDKNVEVGIEKGLEKIAKFIGVDYSYIYLYSEKEKEIIKSYTWSVEGVNIENKVNNKQRFSLKNFPWVLKKLKEEELVYINDINKITSEAESLKDLLSSQNVRSTLMIPLRYGNNLTGVLGFDIMDEKREWREEEIALFRVLADIFVNVLERQKNQERLSKYYVDLELKNIELEELYKNLEEEFKKGSMLHQQFLPSELPEIENISYDTYFKPASKLGGDFYDVIRLENQFLFYLSDVSGHGLDSSMLNIFLRETINNYLLYQYNDVENLNPSDLLEFISEKYNKESFPSDYFICVLVGVLDLDTFKVTFSNAGFQIPPINVKANGKLDYFNCRGMPISSAIDQRLFDELDTSSYEKAERYLKEGDLLFLTTDGLIEEAVGDEFYGNERLEEVLVNNYKFSTDLINYKIKNDFKSFSGSLVGQDDLTFLTLKRYLEIIATFEKQIKSDIERMYQLLEEISEFIGQYYKMSDLFFIGLQEIMTNAIEHGNKMNYQKEVKIKVEVTKEYIKAIVTDEGIGFKWQDKIEQKLDIENDIANEQERGRGIKLANKLCDEIWYNQKGNQANLFHLREDKKR